MFLRQSTASQEIILGPFLDDTDGKTAETGLTIANTDIKLWKSGGTTESDKNSGGATHIAGGRYYAVLDDTDTNTVGMLEVAVSVSGALPVRRQFYILEEAVYDQLFAGSAAGYQVPIWSSSSATVNLSGTTIKTATDIESDTQDLQSRIPAALVGGRIAANAEVVSDKTGFKLASDGLALVTSWTVDITGSLSGSVGSISGVTFPANFGVLVIDPIGNIETVNTVLELDENALTADDAGLPIAGYVWDAQYSQHTTAGTFGKLFDIWRKSNPAIEGTIQASPSPTTTVFKTDVDYPTGAFKHSVLFFADDASIPLQNSPILTVVNNGDGTSTITIEEATTAAPVAGDKFYITPSNHVHAIAAIVNAVWDEATAGHTTSGTTGKALIDSGAAGNPWSTDLSSGYTGTQAGNILNEVKTNSDLISSIGINVYPVSASTPERVAGTTLTFYRDESRSVSVVTDFTLTSLTLEFVVEDQDGVDVYTLADGSISRSNQTFTVAITTAVTAGLGQYRWSMRDVTGGGSSVIAMGVLTVQEAASNA